MMRPLIIVATLVCLCAGAFAGPSRGVLVDRAEPQPLTGTAVSAQLAAVMPLWSSGKDLTQLQPLFGVAVSISQPKEKAAAWLAPDVITAFVTATQLGATQKFRPGVSLDWDTPLKYVGVTVVGVVNEGAALGVKTTLVEW